MTFRHCIVPFILMLAGALSAQERPSPEVMKKLQEAYELQQEQRYADALAKLDEVEAAAPNSPELHNMRGALYLTPALRDFNKAQTLLDKALALQPDSIAPRFNHCELLFVKHEWAPAKAAFQKVLDDFPKLQLPIRHLTLYKRLICEVKLDQIAAAEKTLKDHFTFMDDTPAYYYGQAAIAFGKKDEKAAREWLVRAEGIYKKDAMSAYVDALMEARWITNITLPPADAPKSE